MRIGVLKLGLKVDYSIEDNRGALSEAKILIDMLHRGGADVVLFTQIDNDDIFPDWLEYHDIYYSDKFNINSYNIDKLVIINGSIEGPSQSKDAVILNIKNYNAINTFNGNVYYLLCDPDLVLKHSIAENINKFGVWDKVSEADDYNYNYQIIRNDIIYIVQPYNTDVIFDYINSSKDNCLIVKNNIYHFPFEKFPCLYDNNIYAYNENPVYDLMYGGSIRVGRRAYKIAKYLYGYSDDINVLLFGKMDPELLSNIARDDFGITDKHPIIEGLVPYDKFCSKLNSSLSTIVIGDKLYEDSNDIAQRCYESMMAQVVTFIDSDLDKKKIVFGNDIDLKKFMYVSSQKELEQKIRFIKENEVFRKYIIDYQNYLTQFDTKEYCEKLVNIIKL